MNFNIIQKIDNFWKVSMSNVIQVYKYNVRKFWYGYKII